MWNLAGQWSVVRLLREEVSRELGATFGPMDGKGKARLADEQVSY